MKPTANLAIQILPLHIPQEEAYRMIDAAIKVVKQSGLQYVVCPFETVIEGPYEELVALADAMQQACYNAGADSLLVNMKLHRSASKNLAIDDKIGKYKE